MNVYEISNGCVEHVLAKDVENAKAVLLEHCEDYQEMLDDPETEIKMLTEEETLALKIVEPASSSVDGDTEDQVLTYTEFMAKYGTGEPMHLCSSEY